MTNAEEIASYSRNALKPYLNKWGRLLYSSADTLQPGEIYLLGLNPAGESDNEKYSLERDIDELPNREINAYYDEDWIKVEGKEGQGKGKALLQKRVYHLLKQLVKQPESVCSSNLIFIGTNDDTGLKKDWEELANQCFKVHEKIIEIVKPKLILCYGNSYYSPYGFLKSKYIGKEKEESDDAGHGNWKYKGFETKLYGQPVYIAGVPHLSRYDITSEKRTNVVDWITNRLEEIKQKSR